MKNGIYTVAILGVGARGGDIYGNLLAEQSGRFKITALCDLRTERLERFGKKFKVEKGALFTDEKEFFKRKRADLLVVATQDADHARHAEAGFSLGYDILLEKPVTDSKQACTDILVKQKETGRKALVCHVLRYAPAFLKTAELIDGGVIGKLVLINALERVSYWHQAHSYVRGNWRTEKESAPMILAKCCHDLDLLQFYAKSRCLNVSSVGGLTFFTESNAPEGSAARCTDCKYITSCPYSAQTIYVTNWEKKGKPEDAWPYNIVAEAPLTKDKLIFAIQNGPYGRCVFRCDNDVTDHQIVTMQFENGVKAELTMTAFTAGGGRRYHFFGTYGDIVLEMANETITVNRFGKEPEVIDVSLLTENEYGHGGGDRFLIDTLYDVLEGKEVAATSLADSIESHLMGISAEESRKNNGKLVYVHGTQTKRNEI